MKTAPGKILCGALLFLNLLPAPALRAATVLVRIREIGTRYVFDPTNIVINPLDRVVWSNIVFRGHDSTHNPSGAPALWASPVLSQNGTFAFTFTNTGFYPYVCRTHIASHPEQTGTVSVVSLRLTAARAAPNGGAAFSVQGGRAGLTALVEGSADLAAWTPLQTNAFPVSGSYDFEDPAAAALSRRYYRARVLPP